MNFIIYLTFIVILLLYVFFALFKKEPFSSQISNKNQLLEFTISNNYDPRKDPGIMRDNLLVTYSNLEYKNLNKRIQNEIQTKMSNDEIIDMIEKNLNYQKEIQPEINYPIQKRELTIIEFDSIINLVFLKYRFNVCKLKLCLKEENNEIDKYSFNLIKNFITRELSEEATNKLFYSVFQSNISNLNFKSINEYIISYKVDYKNHFEEYEIQMTIYRENKDLNYTIYVNILFDNYNIKYIIKKMFIIGVNKQQKILFNDIYNSPTKYRNKNNIEDLSIDNLKNYDNTLKKYVENYYFTKAQLIEEKRGHCFFKNSKNKLECESLRKIYGQNKGSTGIWDKGCIQNEDCPFFNRNKNYKNMRGGCFNGYCEMPVNLKTFGYKQIDDNKLDDIICYNCEKIGSKKGCRGLNCNKCCEDQKNKSLYPNLASPDYAFPNDFNDRIKNKNSFIKKNMSPIKIIA
jgi:hypothetical protein